MSAPPRIILVERDPAVRNALAFSLGLEGFDVQAADAIDAVDLGASGMENSCLVIDHEPRGAGALGVLKQLEAEGRSLSMVVLATNPCRTLRDRVAAAGILLVEKPLIGDGLSDILRTMFGMPKAI